MTHCSKIKKNGSLSKIYGMVDIEFKLGKIDGEMIPFTNHCNINSSKGSNLSISSALVLILCGSPVWSPVWILITEELDGISDCFHRNQERFFACAECCSDGLLKWLVA